MNNNSNSASDWARQNKSAFVKEHLSSVNLSATSNPSAIFMAGLPGSGKTEFSKNLIKNTNSNILRLDMDEIATNIPGYLPEEADSFRAGATILLDRILDQAIKKHLDFVLDGTFSGQKAVSNIERAIKHGYCVTLIWLVTDPAKAWNYTKQREKIEHRAISRDGFLASYDKIYTNISKVIPLLSDKLTVLIVRDNSLTTSFRPISIIELQKEISQKLSKQELAKSVI